MSTSDRPRTRDDPIRGIQSLRHYYGTALARKGLAPYEIAAMMGHRAGGKLAMERYIHVTERDAREKVAAAFGSTVRDLRASSGAGSEP
jgi:integrase